MRLIAHSLLLHKYVLFLYIIKIINFSSKPLNYAIALNELGPEIVHKYVGQEPSGGKFNDLNLDYSKKPHNPMVNSGSILINSLLQTLMKPEMSRAEKFDEINNYIKRMAGDEYVGFNNSIFLAEKEMADRNYALAYYMRENNCFPKGSNLKDCIDFWYQVIIYCQKSYIFTYLQFEESTASTSLFYDSLC